MGLAFITLLRAFANGGSSLTGLEAISNGVASFRKPESYNARHTLVAMSSILAFLLVGVTLLARWTHAIPYAAGSPTVISQEVRYVLGTSGVAKPLFYIVQAATLLVLYTGGNTSFNGFPYLASFVAGDQFLPRQLTRRGHRLAFSNGILVLAAVAITLLLGHPGAGQRAGGALRDRSVHRLHHGRRGDGEAPSDPPRRRTGDGAWPSTASRPSSRPPSS